MVERHVESSSPPQKIQSLKVGAVAQALPIFIGFGANIIATPFIVSKLGIANFGFWALTGAIAQYGVLFDFGISRGVVRLVALHHTQGDRAREREVMGASVVSIVLVGLVLLSIPLLLPAQLGALIHLGDWRLVRTLFVSSISVLITGLLGSIFAGASIGRGRALAANLGLSFQRLSVVMGGVVAILFDQTLRAFATGCAVGGLLGLIFVLLAIYCDEHEFVIGAPKIATARELYAFSLKGQVFTFCEIIYSQSGKIIVGLVIGPIAAGAYELGSRLALGARSFGTGTVTVISAHFTRGYAANGIAQVHSDYPRLVARNAYTSNFAVFFLAATSSSVVPAWLGFQNFEAVWVVVFLTFSYALNVSTGVATAVALALNRLAGLAISAVIMTGVAIILQLLLVHNWGLRGLLIAIMLVSVISTLVGIIVVHRAAGIPLLGYFRPASGPLILGTVGTALSFPVGLSFSPHDRLSALPGLLSSALLFCAVYLIIGWRLGYMPSLGRVSKWPWTRIRHTPDS